MATWSRTIRVRSCTLRRQGARARWAADRRRCSRLRCRLRRRRRPSPYPSPRRPELPRVAAHRTRLCSAWHTPPSLPLAAPRPRRARAQAPPAGPAAWGMRREPRGLPSLPEKRASGRALGGCPAHRCARGALPVARTPRLAAPRRCGRSQRRLPATNAAA
ncbi:hypothetical protein T492DRAFT_1062031 [Pavlovales sp. CCMP2436]|nr:hypothetical protein T492DRAFT_1062031 [Pavlovales sp. CCMP2436]